MSLARDQEPLLTQAEINLLMAGDAAGYDQKDRERAGRAIYGRGSPIREFNNGRKV